MNLKILYRGPLASCNYGCPYCPFAKQKDTPADHRRDSEALDRFTAWAISQPHTLGILFTPWGEALHLRRYQEAITQLSNAPNIEKVSIQTNLSCRLEWVEQCNKSALALWTTYHPGEVSRERFLAQVEEADRRNVALSVGVVGLKEHVAEIDALQKALPNHIYLWINAYKRVPNYYTPEMLAQYTAVDPLFPINNTHHPSLGLPCRAGESVFSVDGEGTMYRCHFIRQPIGNIYAAGWENALQPRRCTNTTCHCHIGYIHMPHLKLYETFGEGVLERIPKTIPATLTP